MSCLRLIRIIFLFLLSIVPFFTTHASTEPLEPIVDTFLDRMGITRSGSQLDSLRSFRAELEDSTVSAQTKYTLYFQLSGKVFRELADGGLIFSFPNGFDLSTVTEVRLESNCESFSYEVRRYELTENTIALHLSTRQKKEGDHGERQGDCDATRLIIELYSVVNTSAAGRYQIAGLAFDKHRRVIAGPSLSAPFNIMAGPLASIYVYPSDDMTLKAGERISFAAEGKDQFGNVIRDLEFHWTLTEQSDPIGRFVGSTFEAITVGQGQAVAEVNGLKGFSGQLTVVPGELVRMELFIESTQVVGHPLIGRAEIALFDAFDNPKTDYDLQAHPIELVVNRDSIEPRIISDPALFSDGLVDLAEARIVFSGASGPVELFASNGQVSSQTIVLDFNGYEILSVTRPDGSPLTWLYEGIQHEVIVTVTNNGSLTASGEPRISAAFAGSPERTINTFEPHANGIVDTVVVTLPRSPSALGPHDLVIQLVAEFEIGPQRYLTRVQTHLSVDVIPSTVTLHVVENSFRPDTVYPSSSFSFSFDLVVSGIEDTIERTGLIVELEQSGGGEPVRIFDSSPEYSAINGDTIKYRELRARMPRGAELAPGWYRVLMDFTLIVNGARFSLTTPFVDSMYILPELQLRYVTQSLTPTTLVRGKETVLQFTLRLDNDFPWFVAIQESQIRLMGVTSTLRVGLTLSRDSLYPGDNLIKTDPIIIPPGMTDEVLTPFALLSLRIPTINQRLPFVTDFNGERLTVVGAKQVRIVELSAVAINAPYVNTGQEFAIKCRVANLSDSAIGSLVLGLNSNGSSVFDSMETIETLASNDTADLLFDIQASSEPNHGEVFQVEILTPEVTPLEPLDDIEVVTIQRPADLELSYILSGADGGLVSQAEEFTLTIELRNRGEAGATDGTFRLSTGGVHFGVSEPITGTIEVNRPLLLSFRAPRFDTTATFEFALLTPPTDVNTGEPARIDTTMFQIPIRVISLAGDLLVSAEIIGSPLVQPAQEKEMFRLDLTNRITISDDGIRLSDITIEFDSDVGSFTEVSSLLDPSASVFFEAGTAMSTGAAVGTSLRLSFTDFVIAQGQTRTITFAAQFKRQVPSTFTVELDRHDVSAVFAAGAHEGQPVEVSTLSGADRLISQVYAVRGEGLDGSFVIEDNPFHPDQGPARFSYELSQSTEVEFRVFTVTGEEVYARDLTAGAAGTTAGENEITWDGRNNEGHDVRSGVYIVSIKADRTGESARMKVAVIK
ncbi:MAG TPA: FlgD immunoglobulin-like domain containing protein [Candidatus Deferrimicrobium sp.]|nr:FlgD immunoglobulin-like domain containing protein [Candidatus Deferrimicrobium sp.]